MKNEIFNVSDLDWDNRGPEETDIDFKTSNGTYITLKVTKDDLLDLLTQMDENNED